MARSSGYRTRARTAIEGALAGFGATTFTVDDVAAALADAGAEVARTTVYRNLEALVSSGRLMKVPCRERSGFVYLTLAETAIDPEDAQREGGSPAGKAGSVAGADPADAGSAGAASASSQANADTDTGPAPAAPGHPRTVCIDCGEVGEIRCHELDGFAKHLVDSHGFSLSAPQTVLFGRCARCASHAKGE